MKRYIPVSVLGDIHNGIDCSNGGVTSDPNLKLLVEIDGGFITDEHIANDNEGKYLVLELDKISNSEYFKLKGVPKGAAMFGGNFVWCIDGRFREKYGDNPIRVHDRFE